MDDTTRDEGPAAVLVLGATGRTGRHVVDGLLRRGSRVRALVRRPDEAALPDGVVVVPGDLGDAASVARAAAGTRAAFLLWPGLEATGADGVVQALAEHVDHVVLLSAADLHATGPDRPMPGVWADLESLLLRARTTHTFVRAGGFAANTLGWAEQVRRGDTVRLPFPRAGRSLVDERDLAEVAVAALTEPRWRGSALTVTGPETLTQAEQVHTVAELLGRALRVEEQPAEEAHAELAAGLGEAFARSSLAYWASLVAGP
ncbi:SDR family oxidoreductase [Nocardioides sp. CFH 31398]|uniref:SDR family oxidoreductase n=1 Tax=Nocardioides sp. CFH 31398 TaxID=2919579 RepID=UPI001F06929F|nr:NAD(P)H-binding protein [Nocardioides sp. CFH 31398]MCH1867444.1 NAD(P)H-binding protein [Nocardioides sp. CFH 31398]